MRTIALVPLVACVAPAARQDPAGGADPDRDLVLAALATVSAATPGATGGSRLPYALVGLPGRDLWTWDELDDLGTSTVLPWIVPGVAFDSEAYRGCEAVVHATRRGEASPVVIARHAWDEDGRLVATGPHAVRWEHDGHVVLEREVRGGVLAEYPGHCAGGFEGDAHDTSAREQWSGVRTTRDALGRFVPSCVAAPERRVQMVCVDGAWVPEDEGVPPWDDLLPSASCRVNPVAVPADDVQGAYRMGPTDGLEIAFDYAVVDDVHVFELQGGEAGTTWRVALDVPGREVRTSLLLDGVRDPVAVEAVRVVVEDGRWTSTTRSRPEPGAPPTTTGADRVYEDGRLVEVTTWTRDGEGPRFDEAVHRIAYTCDP